MTTTPQRSRYAYQWELPEVFATAINIAVGLLAVGGFVAVLVIAFGESLGFRHRLGDGLYLGLSWVSPALAGVLLFGLVLVWWQVRAWTETQYSGASHHARSELIARVARGHAIVRWNMALFGVLLFSTIMFYVGYLVSYGFNNLPPSFEASYIIEGMQAVGVFVMAMAGFLGARSVLTLRVEPLDAAAPASEGGAQGEAPIPE